MKNIVTISREFGSGGREIGKRLADELGYKYYDKEIITQIANETDLDEEYIRNALHQNLNGKFTLSFGRSFSTFNVAQHNTTNMLVAERKIIRQIGEEGRCVIVGRSADAILSDLAPFNVFVYADMASKIARCRNRNEGEGLTDKQLKRLILQVDSVRKNHHTLVGGGEWGARENYDLMINTGGADVKAISKSVADYVKKLFGEVRDGD